MRSRVVHVLLTSALLVASCTGAGAPGTAPASQPTSPPPPPSSSAATPGLEGRTFLSTAVTVDGAPHELVAGTRIRLDFREGRLGAAAGCNTMGARYLVAGTTLRLADAATTEMGCDPARHDQDDWLFAFLGSAPTVELKGDTLTLRSGTTAITLLDREVAEPDLTLTGQTWILETIVGGDTASSVPAGVRATLLFSGDGRVAVSTGCNDGGGSYQVAGDRLTISGLALTERACTGDAGIVEAAVLAVLNAPVITWEIDASQLRLRAGDQGLDFRA